MKLLFDTFLTETDSERSKQTIEEVAPVTVRIFEQLTQMCEQNIYDVNNISKDYNKRTLHLGKISYWNKKSPTRKPSKL